MTLPEEKIPDPWPAGPSPTGMKEKTIWNERWHLAVGPAATRPGGGVTRGALASLGPALTRGSAYQLDIFWRYGESFG
jgi:hypothetical protein